MTKRMETTVTELVERLKALARPSHLEKLPRFGIAADRAFGVPVPLIRDLAVPAARGTIWRCRSGTRDGTKPVCWLR